MVDGCVALLDGVRLDNMPHRVTLYQARGHPDPTLPDAFSFCLSEGFV